MISGTYKQQCNNYCDAIFFYLNDTLEGVTCISTSDVSCMPILDNESCAALQKIFQPNVYNNNDSMQTASEMCFQCVC